MRASKHQELISPIVHVRARSLPGMQAQLAHQPDREDWRNDAAALPPPHPLAADKDKELVR